MLRPRLLLALLLLAASLVLLFASGDKPASAINPSSCVSYVAPPSTAPRNSEVIFTVKIKLQLDSTADTVKYRVFQPDKPWTPAVSGQISPGIRGYHPFYGHAKTGSHAGTVYIDVLTYNDNGCNTNHYFAVNVN